MKDIHLAIFFVFSMLCSSAFSEVNLINAGIGGNTTKDLLKRIDKDVISQHPDLCIVMVGTNDMLNSRKMISFDEYKENLDDIIKKIKKSGSDVLLMSSPPVDTSYLFQRHDRTLFEIDPNSKIDSICAIVSTLAVENDAYFLNLNAAFKALNLPRHNTDLFIRNKMNSGREDGVHPTELGYHFIAETIYQYMKSGHLIGIYSKIICFGDSITHGDGLMGGGTIQGKNFPSFLSRKLNESVAN